jgi:hypothetical protein
MSIILGDTAESSREKVTARTKTRGLLPSIPGTQLMHDQLIAAIHHLLMTALNSSQARFHPHTDATLMTAYAHAAPASSSSPTYDEAYASSSNYYIRAAPLYHRILGENSPGLETLRVSPDPAGPPTTRPASWPVRSLTDFYIK